MLYLYAVLGFEPRGPGRAGATAGRREPTAASAGMLGEPLVVVREGSVLAVVGVVDEAPAVSAEALRAHDAVVRRLDQASRAILPVRFGTVLEDEAALRQTLGMRQAALRDGLRVVAGCVQMTLRIFGPPGKAGASSALTASAPVPGRPRAGAAAAPQTGTGYLLARAQARRREAAPDVVGRLRAHLDPFVQGERVEQHGRAPLVASVHHLVARERVGAYRLALEAAADDLRPWRLTATGPWAPYAFAPEAVA